MPSPAPPVVELSSTLVGKLLEVAAYQVNSCNLLLQRTLPDAFSDLTRETYLAELHCSCKKWRMFFKPKLLIPPGHEDLFAFYRMQLLWDGYPGAPPKHDPKGKVYPHPLYGVYVIRMSIDEWRRSGDERFLRQSIRAGGRAIKRMRKQGDALIFDYDAKSPFNSTKKVFYSALTQAKYVSAFAMLSETTDESKSKKFARAAEACLKSLLIPLDRGGILVERPHGISLEESPHPIPSYILNGWLSVLENIARYARASKSAEADLLVRRSIPQLIHLLPLYDMPEMRTSRYALAGTVPFQLKLPAGCKVVSAHLSQPQGPAIRLEEVDKPRKWSVEITSAGVGNMIVSYEPGSAQVLTLVLNASDAGVVTLTAPDIGYHPVLGQTYSKVFSKVASVKVLAGEQRIAFQLPLSRFGAAAGPTNFKKLIAGKQHNSYHTMHIKSLRQLHEITGEATLLEYADKWTRYTKEWSSMPVYQGKNLALPGSK